MYQADPLFYEMHHLMFETNPFNRDAHLLYLKAVMAFHNCTFVAMWLVSIFHNIVSYGSRIGSLWEMKLIPRNHDIVILF